MTINNSHVI